MSEPVLQIEGLSIRFGGLRAVDDMSLDVTRHRITTIIGPNGAGKSTLFNLISGAIKPQTGRVRLDGVDVTGEPPYRLRERGLARSFQITNLFFELSAAENLRLAAQVLEPPLRAWLPIGRSTVAAARGRELLNRFGLLDKADYPVGKLSHGEQRRLEVAVTMASRPKVMLLDEPTQGMSHADTQETAALIRSLSSEVSIVLIEHDIGLVMSLSDYVVVMHQGQKLAEGTPAEVRANPAVQAAYFGHA